MKKSLFALLALIIFFPACQRTSREVWEDTKSATRYMNKGLRSFMGRHVDSSSYAFKNWDDEEDSLIALSDDDRYMKSGMNDLGEGIPLSKESPGDPGSPIPGIDGFKNPDGALAALFKNIRFETDHYTVNGKDNLETLQTIADYLTKHPHTYVFVEGHADERGAAAYNLSLGSRRANSVRSLLVQNGVSPDQLFAISYGKERPLTLEHHEGAWSQNRRAQFRLYER